MRWLLAQKAGDYLRVPAALLGARWMLRPEVPHFGAFGNYAWWAPYRPWHALLWLSFAATGQRAFLYTDAMLGAALKIRNHQS